MPVLEALKNFSYDRVKLKKGDKFKCKGKHVHLVVGSGLAKVPAEMVHTPTGIEPAVMTYHTRQMEAESPDYSSYTKPRLQAMLDDKRLAWKSWESKAVLIDRLKEQK
jgi:hypothetical protein